MMQHQEHRKRQTKQISPGRTQRMREPGRMGMGMKTVVGTGMGGGLAL